MIKYDAELKLTDIEVIDGETIVGYGYIYNDSKGRFIDNEYVRTSTIKVINLEEGYLKTRNTTYKLLKYEEEEN